MRIFTAAFAIAAGFIVLLGYFFPAQLESYRLLLVDWAIVIAGMAVLVGIFNLVAVQMEKIRNRQKGWIYGVLLIVSLFIAFLSGIILGPQHPYMRLAMDAIIVPVEASLMAILAVTLIYASIRLLRRRVDMMSIVFLVVAVVFLIAILPTPFGPLLGERGNQALVDFLGMFSHGGTRGLLIGIALGTLLTGLRVLFGIDRPYGGN
jgi:cytochrome bd-type quinol oxidase subunit 2